jgi:hypothetical protein
LPNAVIEEGKGRREKGGVGQHRNGKKKRMMESRRKYVIK